MDILHDFYIKAPRIDVFKAVSEPHGLDKWWTKTAALNGTELELHFGPDYDWRATVTKVEPGAAFEFRMTRSDDDWNNSVVGFTLEDAPGGTQVRFYHKGWPQLNEHFRISSFCWAMYLRLLKMNLENGLVVPYEDRLDV